MIIDVITESKDLFYKDNILNIYNMLFYYSTLMILCENIFPQSGMQEIFCIFILVAGTFLTTTILGAIANIDSNNNKK
jgi:hypothetical protein